MQSKLTLKQRKFLKHYMIHHNLAQAAKYAGSQGNGIKSLSAIGGQILDSLGMSFQEKLSAYGLTDEAMMKTLNDGLKANRVQLASYEGIFKDERRLDDQPTRLKAVELLGRMKGVFVDRHELTGKDGGDLILQVNPAKSKKGPRGIVLDED